MKRIKLNKNLFKSHEKSLKTQGERYKCKSYSQIANIME
jgi:hypothetical protein